MAAYISDVYSQRFLNAMLAAGSPPAPTAKKLALYDDLGNEITNIPREDIAFTDVASNAVLNNSVINISHSDSGTTVQSVGIWDTEGTPNLMAFGDIGEPFVTDPGKVISIPENAIGIAFNPNVDYSGGAAAYNSTAWSSHYLNQFLQHYFSASSGPWTGPGSSLYLALFAATGLSQTDPVTPTAPEWQDANYAREPIAFNAPANDQDTRWVCTQNGAITFVDVNASDLRVGTWAIYNSLTLNETDDPSHLLAMNDVSPDVPVNTGNSITFDDLRIVLGIS